MNSLMDISEDWARATVTVAQGQEFIPNSPAERHKGEVQLCAAACVAYAGLMIRRPNEEGVFRSKLGESNDKQVVIAAFEYLGLSSDLCSQTMKTNDSTPQELRITTLRQILGLEFRQPNG